MRFSHSSHLSHPAHLSHKPHYPLTKCHLRKCRQKHRNRETTDRNAPYCNTKTMRFIRERHPVQTQAACIRAVKTYQQHRKRHHNKTQKDTFCGLKGIILHRRKPSANAHIRQKQTYTIDCQTFILAHFSLRYLPAQDFIFKITPYRALNENQNVTINRSTQYIVYRGIIQHPRSPNHSSYSTVMRL